VDARTWQGWAATAAYVVALAGWIVYRREDMAPGLHFDVVAALPVLLLTAVFVLVCWFQGESPGPWRWGR